jgi:hypothetical protein
VITPSESITSADPEITVDFVGSISNAAKVIASLHIGEKRLVFVDSRRQAEELGADLRDTESKRTSRTHRYQPRRGDARRPHSPKPATR